MIGPSRIDLLEIDVDLRLGELWRQADAVPTWDLAVVARFIRAAYAAGYGDALREDRRGCLYVDNGYELPKGVVT